MGEGLLIGAEMIQRRLHHQSLPQHGRQLTELGTWSTLSLQTDQQAGEWPFQSPPWLVCLPGSPLSLLLPDLSALYLGSSESDSQQPSLYSWGLRGCSDSAQFQGLLD